MARASVRETPFSYPMPCPFTGPKMFCAGPNFLSQPKNLTAFSASSKTFVPAQKLILRNANHLFAWHKIFVTGTKCQYIFGLAQKIWTSTKHFGTCKRTRQKCFWQVPIFCARTKMNLHIVPGPNFLYQTKRCFAFSKFSFSADTKSVGVALNEI